jgi:drug/metabolite transporter (DMT)-like permease
MSPLNAFLLWLLIIIWGSSFVVVRLALNEGLTPIAIATFRFLVASPTFLTVLMVKKVANQGHVLRALTQFSI